MSNKAEKMLYQENKLGADLVIMFILLNMVFTIFNLRDMPIDTNIGIFTMYNILLSLAAFLASTKMRVYNSKWAYTFIAVAVIQCFRVLRIPTEYEAGFRSTLMAFVFASAVALVVGCVITIRRTAVKTAYENSLKA